MTTFNFIEYKNEISNIENKKISRRHKKKFNLLEYQEIKIIWALFECIGREKDDGFDWQYQSSSSELNNGIAGVQVLQILNSLIVFNDYTAKENDYLSIQLEYVHPAQNKKPRPYVGDFITYIFYDKWNLNTGYEHIDNIYELLKKGEIIIEK